MVDAIKEVANNTAIGIKRMMVTICCVAAITFIDYMHTVHEGADMTTGSITAIAVIAALGGVDVWKNGILKSK